MAKVARAVPLWFEGFLVVVLRLLVLLYGLLVDVVVVAGGDVGAGAGAVSISASFFASVIHELPMFLDGTRNPFSRDANYTAVERVVMR